MEGLIRIQVNIKTQIAKDHSNFMKSSEERTISRSYIKTRLSSLEVEWERFQSNHYKIVAMTELTQDNEYLLKNIYDEVKEQYYEYKEDLDELLESMLIAPVSSDCNIKKLKKESSVMLPIINIPVFSGKYTEWQTFSELFELLIHKNSELENVQKLYYLKSHVTGEPEQLLRHVPITEANYEKSWDMMKRRYSNKRYLANNILTRFIDQKRLLFESSKGIRQLLDTTSECLSALENLNFDVSTWDLFTVYLVTEKLDRESRKLWEQKVSDNLEDTPSLKDLYKFMESRYRTLELLELGERKPERSVRENICKGKTHVFHVAAIVCWFCRGNHTLGSCPEFCKIDLNSRLVFIRNNNLCYNCLGSDHRVTSCKGLKSCQRCHRRHHTLLHVQKRRRSFRVLSEEVKSQVVQKHCNGTSVDSSPPTKLVSNSRGQILLPTAVVEVETKKACARVRALLDQGSQASFITERAVQFLGLRKIPAVRVISSVGGDTQTINHMVELKIQSTTRTFSHNIQAYVVDNVSSILPTHTVNISNWPELRTLHLADPNCEKSCKVDLLLGADVYGYILKQGIRRNATNTLIAQDTQLGWIISGFSCERLRSERFKM